MKTNDSKNRSEILGRDADTVKGATHKAVGKVKQAAGKLTGDPETRAEGTMERARGAVQETFGKAKETARGANRGMKSNKIDRA